jgi:hypothetical protein
VRRLAARALTADSRAPVLYLRDLPGANADEEEQLMTVLGRVGPVITLGRPGATPVYAPGDAWQRQVLAAIDRAAWVVIRGGLRWELEQCVERVALSRLVLLTPAAHGEYRAFVAWAEPLLCQTLPEYVAADSGSAMCGALTFDVASVPRLQPIAVSLRDQFALTDAPYLAAFHRALAPTLGLNREEPAAAWRDRLFAAALDFIAIGLPMCLIQWLEPHGAAAWLCGLVLAVAWFIGFETLADGQTPGKMLYGIRVVSQLGYAPTPAQACLRLLAKFLIVPFHVVLILAWVLLQRPYYDLMASTRVVRGEVP